MYRGLSGEAGVMGGGLWCPLTPPQMVQALSSFMEFCYLVQRSVLDEDDLVAIDAAVADFH